MEWQGSIPRNPLRADFASVGKIVSFQFFADHGDGQPHTGLGKFWAIDRLRRRRSDRGAITRILADLMRIQRCPTAFRGGISAEQAHMRGGGPPNRLEIEPVDLEGHQEAKRRMTLAKKITPWRKYLRLSWNSHPGPKTKQKYPRTQKGFYPSYLKRFRRVGWKCPCDRKFQSGAAFPQPLGSNVHPVFHPDQVITQHWKTLGHHKDLKRHNSIQPHGPPPHPRLCSIPRP